MMNTIFPVTDFDSWADSYDQTVLDETRFPFAGYQAALLKVFALADAREGMAVLDLGTGTGNLALRFAEAGCKLWCTDFSPSMLERAQLKLPQARFIQFDLREDWPSELERPFDRFVSAYVFHHFELPEKVDLIEKLARYYLRPGGRIVIADIAFSDRQTLESVKLAAGDEWEDEFYWLADEALSAFQQVGLQATFHPVSFCGGVFSIR